MPCPDPATPGNLAAVGTMEPEIEVWDLDTIDVLEPAAVLGGYSRKDAARKPSRSDDAAKRKFRKGSHKSSVLALAWNPQIQNVLASGSADKTIKARRRRALWVARCLFMRAVRCCRRDCGSTAH